MEPTVAFITVSHGPDRERCELLCRSLDAMVRSFEHWIVVDRADERAFRTFQRPRTTVVTTEEVLPVWLRRVNLRRLGLRSNIWLQLRGKPVRGWLIQQLAKLELVRLVGADVLVHTDSDVALVRPFQPSSLVRADGRVRLFSNPGAVDGAFREQVFWHRSAEKLLGLPETPLPLPDFVTSLVPWRRDNALALLDHIEATAQQHWLRALASAWHVSEYTLYGRFVSDVLGERSGQYPTSKSLCWDYWTPSPLTPAEIGAILEGLEPDVVAVSLTSKARIPPSSYEPLLRRCWAAASADWAPGRGTALS